SSFLLLSFSIILPYLIVDLKLCNRTIDTVPTPSVYTNNAIVASDYVMIPLQAEEESTNNIQNYISYL
ncbi:AAA family ATPase, partial [Enterococcus faecalis]|uniref:AAA family ATPase n=1 Tax=Enterococcus faecalis TaxID=1351 RepID=UPI00338DD76B